MDFVKKILGLLEKWSIDTEAPSEPVHDRLGFFFAYIDILKKRIFKTEGWTIAEDACEFAQNDLGIALAFLAKMLEDHPDSFSNAEKEFVYRQFLSIRYRWPNLSVWKKDS